MNAKTVKLGFALTFEYKSVNLLKMQSTAVHFNFNIIKFVFI